jgi:hypothetical protein
VGQICPKIKYRKSHILTQHTTTRRHNAGQLPPPASTTAHCPPAPAPKQCACSPHHRQHRLRSVCYILRWGRVESLFLSVHLKAKFRESRAMSATASSAASDSLLPVPGQCICLPHYGQCQVPLVCSILCWGLPGALKRQPIKKLIEGRGPGLMWLPINKKRNNQPKGNVGGGGGVF